jgi:hypothetical protein
VKFLKAAIFCIGIEVILFICVANYFTYSDYVDMPMLSIITTTICLAPLLILHTGLKSSDERKPKQKRKPKDD